MPPIRPLTLLAWWNVGLHLLGLVLAALAMAPGTPVVSLAARLGYLAASPPGWAIAWSVWMGCALSLIAFLAVLAARLPDSDLARLGVVVAVVGAGFDLFCDLVYILVLPTLAAAQAELLFETIERATGIASLVIANGGYSVGILLISAALQKRRASRPAVLLGYAVAAAGLFLATAGITGSARQAQWATGPTMLLFCAWVVVVARTVPPGGKSP
jgi:hypothetical protein